MSRGGAVDDDPLLGRELGGRYRLLRRIGKGGMGTVYVARHDALQRDVVVKVISRDRPEPEIAARFKREALAVGQLVHPNIVSVYDFGVAEEDGTMYLVMELLVGRSLRALLDERRTLPVRESLDVVADVARGLAHAHERGIVHRDLKPGNIMVVDAKGGRSFAKILDFGIAKLTAAAVPGVTATDTGSGMMLGTPGYIAPEHVNGVHDDPRSDLYSLGCIWFELLTGSEVFSGETPMKVVLRHVGERAPRVLERKVGVPPGIDALVNRLLAKDPQHRPASAEALLAELGALASQLARGAPGDDLALSPPPNMAPESVARPPELPTSVGVAPTTKVTPFDTGVALESSPAPRSRAALVAGVAAVIVGVIAIGTFLSWAGGSLSSSRPLALPPTPAPPPPAFVQPASASSLADAGTRVDDAAGARDAGALALPQAPPRAEPAVDAGTTTRRVRRPKPPEASDDGFLRVHTSDEKRAP